MGTFHDINSNPKYITILVCLKKLDNINPFWSSYKHQKLLK